MPTIASLPAADRPREKFASRGADALTDAELVAIVLRESGMRGRSVRSLAEELVARFHGLGGLAAVDFRELQKVPGIGPAKAIQLAAAFEIGRRARGAEDAELRIRSADDVAASFGSFFLGRGKEIFRVLALGPRGQVLASPIVGRGSVGSVQLTAREVIAPALAVDAVALILMHNHPSGSATPSGEDIAFTERVRSVAGEVGVAVLDHVVFSGDGEWETV